MRFIKGHSSRRTRYEPLQIPNPDGLCMCGCGQPAPICNHSRPERGFIKGQPQRYIVGHVARTRVVVDETGNIYGRLTVTEKADPPAGVQDRGIYWKCQCECGNAIIVRAGSLRATKKPTRSCGCNAHGRPTHGYTGSREYITWSNSKYRCTNPNNPQWHNYGGRGITMCYGWQTSFESFLADMGQKPLGLQIDRTDNNGGYWCGHCHECVENNWPPNCRWVTAVDNAKNTRRSLDEGRVDAPVDAQNAS